MNPDVSAALFLCATACAFAFALMTGRITRGGYDHKRVVFGIVMWAVFLAGAGVCIPTLGWNQVQWDTSSYAYPPLFALTVVVALVTGASWYMFAKIWRNRPIRRRSSLR